MSTGDAVNGGAPRHLTVADAFELADRADLEDSRELAAQFTSTWNRRHAARDTRVTRMAALLVCRDLGHDGHKLRPCTECLEAADAYMHQENPE